MQSVVVGTMSIDENELPGVSKGEHVAAAAGAGRTASSRWGRGGGGGGMRHRCSIQALLVISNYFFTVRSQIIP